MNVSTEQDLKQLLSYNDRLVDDRFTEVVLHRLKKTQRMRQRILLIGTLCAFLMAVILVAMSSTIFQPVFSFTIKSPILFTLALIVGVGSCAWLTSNDI